jgi:hypothetical protein
MAGNSSPDPPLPTAAFVALNQGNVIEAIKAVREAEGLDLRSAKVRVDRYIAAHPLLRDELARRRQDTKGRFIRAMLIVDAFIVAAVLWWFFLR